MVENTSTITYQMFEHACAFVDCAEYCQIEPNNIKHRTKSHSVSGIVNSAFACEVFIKTLLVFHGVSVEELRKHKYGHDLKNLWGKFKAIDSKTAVSVEQALQAWFNSQNENMFNEFLDNISNAFDYWRYIYEKSSGSINLNFLIGFRKLLRDICCNCLYGKSWSEYIKSHE